MFLKLVTIFLVIAGFSCAEPPKLNLNDVLKFSNYNYSQNCSNEFHSSVFHRDCMYQSGKCSETRDKTKSFCCAVRNVLPCCREITKKSNLCTNAEKKQLTVDVKMFHIQKVLKYNCANNFTSHYALNPFTDIEFITANATMSALYCYAQLADRDKGENLQSCKNDVERGVWEENKIKKEKDACKSIADGLECLLNLARGVCTDNHNKTWLVNWAKASKWKPVLIRNRTAGAVRPNTKMCQKKLDFLEL